MKFNRETHRSYFERRGGVSFRHVYVSDEDFGAGLQAKPFPTARILSSGVPQVWFLGPLGYEWARAEVESWFPSVESACMIPQGA